MDFHSLTRKELQFLCKLNKIPANMTNVAMADALQSAEIVEGIEKFINVTQSEKADLDESKENVEELSSPKVPNTKCRTTNRKHVKTIELENLKPTETRTTRRTAKKIAGEVEESKNDAMETPALSSTRRKAMATSSCRNVNSQLNDCELEAKEDQKSSAAVVTKSRRKVATTSTTLKKESTVKITYSTRRSTRQNEKKSGEPRVGKESEKAVEINSMLDEMNVASDEVLTVEGPDNTVSSAVEGICDAFDELVVVVEDVDISEEKEDSGEVDNRQKLESDEISNLHDEVVLKEDLNDAESDPIAISNSCENGDLEEKKHESEVVAFEKHTDSILDENSNTESDIAVGDDIEVDAISCNTESLNATPELRQDGICCDVSEMNTEAPSEFLNSNFTPDDVNTNDVLVDETLDVTPAIDNLIEEVSDDMAVAVSSEVSDDFEVSPINKNNEPSPNNLTPINNQKDEITLPEAYTQLTEEKSSDSRVRKEIEAGVKNDSLLEEVNVTFQEVLPVEVLENTMDAGDSVAKMEDVSQSFEKLIDESAAAHKREEKEYNLGNLQLKSDVIFEEYIFKSIQEQNSESFLDEIESGSSTMVNDMILDNPGDFFNLKDENNFSPNEEYNTKYIDEGSECMNLKKTVNPCDIFTPAHDEKTENDIKEVDDESVDVDVIKPDNESSILKKNLVSDDKENSVIVVGNKSKKENKDENGVKLSLEDKSLRQLRKQFKELKLKTINQDAATGRPALQPLCENQMVGGEAKI